MAKIDLNQTNEANKVGSRSQRKAEHEKAVEVLKKAKQIPRKVVFLKQGAGDFTMKKKDPPNVDGMMSRKEAVDYMGITTFMFSTREKRHKIPYQKTGKGKFYKKEDLDKNIENHPIRDKKIEI